jgi:hypothetical protein
MNRTIIVICPLATGARQSGERTRPRVLAMAPRHRELFLAYKQTTHPNGRKIVSARALKAAREARALPGMVQPRHFT